jgi:nucleotide-binding universal stress UspA family protein
MIKGFNHILFTSDLTENSRHAFSYAAMLSMQFKGKITLLHIVENLPESIDHQLRDLFGEKRWRDILHEKVDSAKRTLIGKAKRSEMIRAGLNEFCRDAGIARDECGYVETETVINEGVVVDEILSQAKTRKCDVIIMGANQGLLTGTSLGRNIKSVIKNAKVPVIVVPPVEN